MSPERLTGEPLFPLCPLGMARDAVDTVSEMGRLFTAGLAETSALPSSLGRSLASVLEANSLFFGQLTDLSRRATTGPAPPRAPEAPSPPETARAVVLRAAPGEEASGAFVLENTRAGPITATVLPTGFVDPDGERVDVTLRLEPSRVALGAGQEAVVTVTVVVPAGLAPSTPLRGAIHVPGLTTSMVPVVVNAE